MLGSKGIWANLVPTFESPKVAKARLPFPFYLRYWMWEQVFLLLLVTFWMIVWCHF
jgi:hypothetical protein